MEARKDILKFMAATVAFLIAALVLYVLLVCFWGEVMPEKFTKNLKYKSGEGGFVHTRFKEAETYGNSDIVFLGSSHTYRGFDTRIFGKYGYRSFNLGSSSQTPAQTLVLVKRYLDELDPEIIIYEVYPGSFAGDGVESALDLIANIENDFESAKMAFRINHLKVYNSLIFGFYKNLIHPNELVIENPGFGNDIYVSGGYLQSDLRFWKPVMQEIREIKLDKMQVKCFLQICKIIKEKNIKLVFVEAPVTKEFYKTYSNKQSVEDLVKSQGTFYDFNKMLNLNDSLHFYDAHHLNQNGVEEFNEGFIKKILIN